MLFFYIKIVIYGVSYISTCNGKISGPGEIALYYFFKSVEYFVMCYENHLKL